MRSERILRRKSCSCGSCASCNEAAGTLRRRATGSMPAREGQAPDAVQRVLNAPGRPLEPAARGFFESRFGHDFAAVRVHTDAEAAASARSVGAAAWTVGQHIAFDAGRFDPARAEGQELLAHELAHTLQQRDASPAQSITIGAAADPAEHEADRSAAAALQGETAPAPRKAPAKMQLQQAAPAPNLAENASPFLASAIGSVTVDGFDTGKSEVSKPNEAKLVSTAATIRTLLQKYPAGNVRIIGHTDAVGKEDSNQLLGQSRAEAVRGVLMQAGLPPAILQAESKGETALLIKSQKAEARNRRVDVRFDPGMTPPSLGVEAPKPFTPLPAAPPPPPVNLNLPPEPQHPVGPVAEHHPVPPAALRDVPPGPKIPGRSIDDVFSDAARKITSFLPKPLQEKAQPLVQAALKKGTTALLDAGLKDVGVDDKGRKAIGKAAEATLQIKFGGSN